MAKPIVQRPRADQDIDEIFAFLNRRSPVAASKFLDEIEKAYAALGEQPAIGSPRHAEYCPELPEPLRFLPVHGFSRLLIYYMDRPKCVEIIRVWDAARGLDALMDDMGP